MKKVTFVIILFFACGFANAQPANASFFFPLKVGNVWVYYGTSSSSYFGNCSWFTKCRVENKLDTVSNRYFALKVTNIVITGGYIRGFFADFMRVDGLSSNLYSLYSCSIVNEVLMDSLNSQKFDTASSCGGTQLDRLVCVDTSIVNVFGNSLPSKQFFSRDNFNTVFRRYVKGIGISNYRYLWGPGTDDVRLIGCYIDSVLYGDTNEVIGIQNLSNEVPIEFSLFQNYPNPFNPVTNIGFKVSKAGQVKINISNVLGHEISKLVDEFLKPGTYEAEWDATNYPSGVYFYKLEAGDYSETKKMVVLK